MSCSNAIFEAIQTGLRNPINVLTFLQIYKNDKSFVILYTRG